ncbi:MAG TPA: sigma-70 family RNA polymerase sigma factor [Saprospiraceae bacterium]|nr:sigma-70 family RNA polymerase sigma factor [Saprospiraceae bacterium]
MNANIFTEDQLLEAIKAGGNDRQAAIRKIYDDRELKGKVIDFVRNHGGNTEDGQDMFHEGIIVLDRNIREEKFRGESSLQGYLYSICRFLWMNRARKQSKTRLTDESQPFEGAADFTPESNYFDEERKSVLRQILEQLGERCQKILNLWQLSYSMDEIAEAMGLANEQQARKAKYRCHLSLLEYLQQNPNLSELLKNYM